MTYSQPTETILVAAAADIAPLDKELSEFFAKAGRARVRFSFGASGALARQIAQGAPYDVYLSANERFVQELAASGKLIPGTVSVYAQGRLGLWSKSGKFRNLKDLTAPAVLHVAIANPEHAPYGLAAREMLKGAGLWPALEKRIVYGENVQQTFQFAESGNAEACITAWSLVKNRDGILLPAGGYPPIRQAGGVVAATRYPAAARAFMKLLAGPEGKAILARHGLDPAK